jgi:hypothetical protein
MTNPNSSALLHHLKRCQGILSSGRPLKLGSTIAAGRTGIAVAWSATTAGHVHVCQIIQRWVTRYFLINLFSIFHRGVSLKVTAVNGGASNGSTILSIATGTTTTNLHLGDQFQQSVLHSHSLRALASHRFDRLTTTLLLILLLLLQLLGRTDGTGGPASRRAKTDELVQVLLASAASIGTVRSTGSRLLLWLRLSLLTALGTGSHLLLLQQLLVPLHLHLLLLLL